MASQQLPALPDEFRRVLCVVAHPDDIEYGTSAAVAAWTDRGIEVAYLLLTRGEAGMDSSPPEVTGPLREREQIAASAAVGVTRVDFLDHPDGVLVYGLDLRRDIALAIRRFRPDAVVVGGWEVETPWGFNQADHRVAGLAALDAVRDAANRWVFTDQLGDGLEPWQARWLLIAGDPAATHGVDVTGAALDRGIAALEAHAEYLANLSGHPAPRDMLTQFAAMSGRAMGVEHAVLFRAIDLEARPSLDDEPAPQADEAVAAGGGDG
ncbi:PIG-L deacetylase family protein [Pseudonocardia lacus]|uniref:PIG-L deacetylase family protein n=1 Tax=Pseudonocardia lacus TaxID=2835865 RepID=UPI001BDCD45F|nr:PIG-L deacetylase family protein [Pseudonocardia lacus]